MVQSADVPREDDPRQWLRSSPLIDLEDPKLRLRVHALVQLCNSDAAKAAVLYRFVKRMPLVRRLKLRPRTARAVLDAGRGDAPDKATLLVAMLRMAGIPARLRYVTLHGDILRGLASGLTQADRPFVETWIAGAWQQTDTYIYDADTMAAARQRLKDRGWTWGYGIHVDGRMLWDARESSWMAGRPDAANPMVLRDVGVFHDPLDYLRSPALRARGRRLLRLVRWNMGAPAMNRALRGLRADAKPSGARRRGPP